MEKDVKNAGGGTATEDASSQEETVETEEQETEQTGDGTEQAGEKTGADDAADDASTSEESTEDGDADDDGKPHQKTVPYERLKEVIESGKEKDRQIGDLRERLAKLETAQQASQPKKWEELTVPQLRDAVRYYQSEETANPKMVEMLEDLIIEKKASEVVGKVEGKRSFKERQTESWSRALGALPELKDQNSELFKRTAALIKSDPRYGEVPEGYEKAAYEVYTYLDLERKRAAAKKKVVVKSETEASLRKNGLESGGRPASTTNASLDALEKAAAESKNPFGPEWRRYMRALDKTKK